jgi:hypothetical protein
MSAAAAVVKIAQTHGKLHRQLHRQQRKSWRRTFFMIRASSSSVALLAATHLRSLVVVLVVVLVVFVCIHRWERDAQSAAGGHVCRKGGGTGANHYYDGLPLHTAQHSSSRGSKVRGSTADKACHRTPAGWPTQARGPDPGTAGGHARAHAHDVCFRLQHWHNGRAVHLQLPQVTPAAATQPRYDAAAAGGKQDQR